MTSDVPEAEPKHVDLVEALGGKRGLVDGGLPGAIFVTAYTLTGQNLPVALWSAVSVGVLFTLIRVVRRESLQFAITGLVGIAIAAFIASRTGRAQDFFLPSLLKDVGLGLLYLVSILVRWPLIGVIVGPLTGEGMTWRKDPARTRAYQKATWPWVGLFVVRLSVQLPLYFLGATVALGYVRVAMGIPLYLVTLWLSYAAIRSAPPMRTKDEVE
ncbi:MAG: DUF3159 domain-containing protein [Candidatus Nanopelagicales bacterium]